VERAADTMKEKAVTVHGEAIRIALALMNIDMVRKVGRE
jgi:hypothetical protein